MAIRPRLVFVALALALTAAPLAQGLGSFGAVVTSTTSGVVGPVTAIGAANIGFLDNDPADGSPGTAEAIVLSIDGSATVKVGDILLDPGTGLTGTVGTTIQSAPGGVLDFTVGATNVVDMLRFVDTLPVYANGGPDGVFNPGEPLFIDLDASLSPGTADRLLVSGTGVTGTVGGAVSATQNEGTWDDGIECIYVDGGTTASALDAGDTLVSTDSGGCPANGAPLVALTGGVKITGGDATFTAGEEAYITTATTGPVTGDYRLTTTLGGAFATVVNCGTFGVASVGDLDCGAGTLTSLANVKVTMASRSLAVPAISYFDVDANGQFGSNDKLLFDVDGNAFVSPPDVRLNTASGGTFGSRPTIAAAGEVHGILDLALAAVKIIWLDTALGTVGTVDSGEAVAFDLDGDLQLDIGDICIRAPSGTFGSGLCTPGTQRIATTTAPSIGGTWKDAATAVNTGVLGYLDANVNNKYDLGDSLYVHFGAAVLPQPAASPDILIANDAGSIGTTVTTSPGTLKAFPGGYRGLDIDGNAAFGVGDILYIERGLGTVGRAEPGDLHITSGSGVSGNGKNIKEGDADALSVLIDPTASGALFSYRDIDNLPGFTLNDPVFLMPRATGCPPLGSDVVLAKGVSTLTSGNFVGGAVTTCVDLAAGPAFGFTPAGTYTTAALWYLDLNGDATVDTGDVRFAGITQGAAGTRVGGTGGTSTTDLNTALTLAATTLRVADSSGDGVAAGLETVILDRDGNNLFTPGDLVLSTGTTTSTGGGGGGGGGATTTPVTTTSSTVTTSVSTTTSSATNTSSSVSTSASATSSGPTQLLEADLNELIKDSLDVDRQDGVNVLTWDDVGADFYQVWSKDSPYALQDELPGSQTSYTDAEGSSGTDYLVTACIGPCTLTVDDVNDGNVPGYDGVPKGEDASKPSGFIPGPSPVLLLGLVALAALLVRRRLA